MSNVLDQIKSNAVPAAVMRSAAKGALSVPAAEMLEILVYLTQNSVFGQEAKMTLASWDAESAVQVISDPTASPDILGYFWMESNRRRPLMPALVENPAISENMLIELAASGSHETVGLLLDSRRARSSPAVMEALKSNPAFSEEHRQKLKAESQPGPAAEEIDAETEAAHRAWHEQHATDIAAEEGKPFEYLRDDELAHPQEPPGSSPEEHAGEARAPQTPRVSEAQAASAMGFQARAQALQEKQQKLSVLQKIGKMNAAERVKAAFTGGREERAILIRDGAKVVQSAVLASPKLTEPEVEGFAAAKNVSEFTLREIARNRRFMKNYNVGRNLVGNPKCPLDLSLTLVKNLMIFDLKSLRSNKEVPEVIRQVAFKLYREKTGPAKEGGRG